MLINGGTCQNYALNSGYALNNDMRLITGFYGICIEYASMYICCLKKMLKLVHAKLDLFEIAKFNTCN